VLLFTRTFAEEFKLEENKFQGKRATDKKIINGTPREGIFKIAENTKLITISWKRGLRITHPYPNTDCL
jgi:hypothetical protein